jgi:hypothetical protein
MTEEGLKSHSRSTVENMTCHTVEDLVLFSGKGDGGRENSCRCKTVIYNSIYVSFFPLHHST